MQGAVPAEVLFFDKTGLHHLFFLSFFSFLFFLLPPFVPAPILLGLLCAAIFPFSSFLFLSFLTHRIRESVWARQCV
jgi:hypothetical protein